MLWEGIHYLFPFLKNLVETSFDEENHTLFNQQPSSRNSTYTHTQARTSMLTHTLNTCPSDKPQTRSGRRYGKAMQGNKCRLNYFPNNFPQHLLGDHFKRCPFLTYCKVYCLHQISGQGVLSLTQCLHLAEKRLYSGAGAGQFTVWTRGVAGAIVRLLLCLFAVHCSWHGLKFQVTGYRVTGSVTRFIQSPTVQRSEPRWTLRLGERCVWFGAGLR